MFANQMEKEDVANETLPSFTEHVTKLGLERVLHNTENAVEN